MRILKFSIIIILLSFITSCDNEFHCYNDKGIVVNIQKYGNNSSKVTILIIKDPTTENTLNTYITFLTHKQYSINDTVYFTN